MAQSVVISDANINNRDIVDAVANFAVIAFQWVLEAQKYVSESVFVRLKAYLDRLVRLIRIHIILRMYCHQSNIVCQSCYYFGSAHVFYVDLLSV